jgi:DNA-binding response OmpR family regulator
LNRPNLHRWALLKGNHEEGTPSKRKGPILVVEDDPDILSSVADILDFEGYAVETAMDGSIALSILENVQPTLILLDMRMPVLNGWEFARILKERGIKVPILVMTAAQDARRWAEEIGAEGFIPKPFHVMDLLDAIAKFHSN